MCVCVCVGKDSPGSESDGCDSRSETGSGEIQPKKVINDVQHRSSLSEIWSEAIWDCPRLLMDEKLANKANEAS